MTHDQAIEWWEAKALWEEQNEPAGQFKLKAGGGGHGGNTYSRRMAVMDPVVLSEVERKEVDNIERWQAEGFTIKEQILLQRAYKNGDL